MGMRLAITGKGASHFLAEAQYVEDYIKAAPRWEGGRTYRGLDDVDISNFPVGATNIDMRGMASWS
ncbi:MAG: hypothetical protein IKR73_05585, partial [Oscillospiraceae bacterium]|nr:hypothetical protein [Oscillospiraceae bacterium]